MTGVEEPSYQVEVWRFFRPDTLRLKIPYARGSLILPKIFGELALKRCNQSGTWSGHPTVDQPPRTSCRQTSSCRARGKLEGNIIKITVLIPPPTANIEVPVSCK